MNALSAQRIEKLSLLLAALATASSLAFQSTSILLGVSVGGGLAAFNFMALRRILSAIFKGAPVRKMALLAILLIAKFSFLALCIFLVIRFLPVSVVAFIIGISVVVFAIFIEGFRFIIRGADSPSE